MDHFRLFSFASVVLCLLAGAFSSHGQSKFQGFTLPNSYRGKQAWDAFKEQYISSDGRVIDDANGGISHSEGQGYGMLLAVKYRDLATFSVLWSWTRTNLQVREDGLFAWKWDPSAGPNPIQDQNNATDGDLLIAWALQRGAELWKNDRHMEEAMKIVRTVRRTMIVDSPYGSLLLPGGSGFQKPDGVVVNLSYWIFPAFLDIKRIDPSYVWDNLYLSGKRLMADARFGKWNLPPDWLFVPNSGPPQLPDEFTPVYGYNAVRIPLYLKWSGDDDNSLYAPFIDWATHTSNIDQLPDLVNLKTNQPGEYTIIPGMMAVYHFIAPKEVPAPSSPTGGYTSYYSACLRLLTKLASEEAGKYSSLPRP